jgi:hypothetical protein
MIVAIVLIPVVLSVFVSASAAGADTVPTVRFIALPGAPAGGVSIDYLAYDPTRHRVWVPAGDTGSVFVVDVTNGRVDTIPGLRRYRW